MELIQPIKIEVAEDGVHCGLCHLRSYEKAGWYCSAYGEILEKEVLFSPEGYPLRCLRCLRNACLPEDT